MNERDSLDDSDGLSAEQRLKRLGCLLPRVTGPVGQYSPTRRSGSTLYVSGHGPVTSSGSRITGKVGSDLDLEAAREAARLVGLNLLATIRAELGSLDRIQQIDRVFGMVNVAPGFVRISEVIDGCSELLLEIFGTRGRHARSAVGMAQLPSNIAVEVELVATLVPEALETPS